MREIRGPGRTLASYNLRRDLHWVLGWPQAKYAGVVISECSRMFLTARLSGLCCRCCHRAATRAATSRHACLACWTVSMQSSGGYRTYVKLNLHCTSQCRCVSWIIFSRSKSLKGWLDILEHSIMPSNFKFFTPFLGLDFIELVFGLIFGSKL